MSKRFEELENVEKQKPKRNTLIIFVDLLKIIGFSAGVKKTHILYKGNINFYQLTRYLKIMDNLKLIEIRENRYYLTGKGKMALEALGTDEGVFEEV